MSVTYLLYAGTRPRRLVGLRCGCAVFAMSGTSRGNIWYPQTLSGTRIGNVRYGHRECPVRTYGNVSRTFPGTDVRDAGDRRSCPVLAWRTAVSPPVLSWFCHGIAGTDATYNAICGTDGAYDAMPGGSVAREQVCYGFARKRPVLTYGLFQVALMDVRAMEKGDGPRSPK
eukprot:1406751-Rhodomonas_salina.2